jgi:hypothetical protein
LTASNAISSRNAPPTKQPGNEASSSSTAERFALTGPSIILDPRIHAYRSDLADVALAGQLFAPHYARPVTRHCRKKASVHEAASSESEVLFEIEAGEEFALLDVTGCWAWGYRRSDHRVGYVKAENLKP